MAYRLFLLLFLLSGLATGAPRVALGELMTNSG